MAIAKTLRFNLFDGTRNRPIYIGYLSAAELDHLSDVPSFEATTSQATIARNIINPPIEDWQRPIDEGKREAIAERFSQSDEFMPNPVLLAVHDRTNVTVSPQVVSGQVTEVFEINVVRPTGSPPPLWILDGQHRVRGLAQSDRPTNPVPFVLLYSDVQSDFTASDFARLFAEVTTEATPLEDLHRDWLQYAFELGPYETGFSGFQARRNAMESVALLCEAQMFDGGQVPNPFFNKIQFNPKRSASPVHGNGLAYEARDLRRLLNAHYFSLPGPTLSPEELATQVARATTSLISTVVTPADRCVFFGSGTYLHKPMEDAFLIGVAARLKVDPAPNWNALLTALNFHTTDWDFSSWATNRGGAQGNTSRRVAQKVFHQIFGDGKLPPGVSDVALFMGGDQASFEMVASHLTPTQRPRTADKYRQTFPVGGRKPFNTTGRPHIRIEAESLTANIGKLEVLDIAQPLSRAVRFTTIRQGVVLHPNPRMELEVRAEYYGGQSHDMKIVINAT